MTFFHCHSFLVDIVYFNFVVVFFISWLTVLLSTSVLLRLPMVTYFLSYTQKMCIFSLWEKAFVLSFDNTKVDILPESTKFLFLLSVSPVTSAMTPLELAASIPIILRTSRVGVLLMGRLCFLFSSYFIYFTLSSNDSIDDIRSMRYSATRFVIAFGEPVAAKSSKAS